MRCQLLADPVGQFADDRPDGFLGVGGLEQDVEAHQFVIASDEFEGRRATTDFLSDSDDLSALLGMISQFCGKA